MQFLHYWSHWGLFTFLLVVMTTASTTIIACSIHVSISRTACTLLLMKVLKHSLPSVLCGTLSNGLDAQVVSIVSGHGNVTSCKNCVLCQFARMFPISVKNQK